MKKEKGKALKVTFDFSLEHYENMMEALAFTKALLVGDFYPIITILRRNTFEGRPFIIQDESNINEALNEFKSKAFPLFSHLASIHEIVNPDIRVLENLYKKLSHIKTLNLNLFVEAHTNKKNAYMNMKFEVVLDDEELNVLKKSLNVIARIYTGQIQQVFSLMYDNTLKYGERFYQYLVPTPYAEDVCVSLLNKIVDKGVCKNPNSTIMNIRYYGIFNKEVHNNARILYDLYKVLMYESGEPRIYALKPKSASGLVLPTIIFPYTFLEVKDKNDCYSFVDNPTDLRLIDGELYLDVEQEYTSVRIDVGDTIYKKYNGKYLVKKE